MATQKVAVNKIILKITKSKTSLTVDGYSTLNGLLYGEAANLLRTDEATNLTLTEDQLSMGGGYYRHKFPKSWALPFNEWPSCNSPQKFKKELKEKLKTFIYVYKRLPEWETKLYI